MPIDLGFKREELGLKGIFLMIVGGQRNSSKTLSKGTPQEPLNHRKE